MGIGKSVAAERALATPNMGALTRKANKLKAELEAVESQSEELAARRREEARAAEEAEVARKAQLIEERTDQWKRDLGDAHREALEAMAKLAALNALVFRMPVGAMAVDRTARLLDRPAFTRRKNALVAEYMQDMD